MTNNPLAHKKLLTVNTPKQIQVGEDRLANPTVVFTPKPETVKSINQHWRIDDEWWRREPISRIYFDVLTASGKQLVIFKDLINNRWYQQSY